MKRAIIHILVGIALVTMLPLLAEASNSKWMITPGVSAGPINANTSERDLVKIYGGENVRSANIEVGEGELTQGTILFPDEPDKRLEIIWADVSTRVKPLIVSLKGKHSIWKTASGISLGTSLKEIEKINGKAFLLAGFGWDGEGTIFDFDNGKLCAIGYCDESAGGIIKRRKIFISLNPTINFSDKVFMRHYEQVQGDRRFLSSNAAMQQLNPTVASISVSLN